MNMKRTFVALLLSTTFFAGAGFASWPTAAPAAELLTKVDLLKKVVDAVKQLLDMYGQYSEVVGKLDKTNRSSEQAAEYLDGVAKRAATFHPQEFVKPPKLGAEQAFSRDRATRDVARKSWEDFLDDDEDEIIRIKARRAVQQSFLDQHRAQLDTLTMAKNAFDELATDPKATAVLQDDAEWAWYHFAVEAEPRMAGIVSDYERIIKEYDRIISRREAEHEAHQAVLRAIRAIQGVGGDRNASNAVPVSPALPSKDPKQPSLLRSAIERAIHSAGGDAVIQQGRQSRGQIDGMRRDRARSEAQAQEGQAGTQSQGNQGISQGTGGGSFGGGEGSRNDCGAPNCQSYEYKRGN
jgi:hypothetical protein